MVRRAALIAAVFVFVATLAVGAWAKKRPAAGPSSAKPALTLLSIDRAQRLIRVELLGFKKAPAGNLFAMTDDRGRHYIAQSVRCTKGDGPALPCLLEIPDGYERHALVSLELHLRGLHSRTIAVPADTVSEVWQAALAEPRVDNRSDGGIGDAATP